MRGIVNKTIFRLIVKLRCKCRANVARVPCSVLILENPVTSLLNDESLSALRLRVPTRARVLCAVSGGLDSVVLLHFLKEIGYKKIVVCHYNHRLRGRASLADAKFVERLAESQDCGFEIENASIGQFKDPSGFGLEAAARLARFSFFERVSKKLRCPTLFLAHHADDQVETILWNLLRGTGPAGLGGMQCFSERNGMTLVRPLLATPKKLLHDFAQAGRIRHREDKTNSDTQHTRNLLRHEIIPFLESKLQRNFSENLRRTATILQEEHSFLDVLASRVAIDQTLAISIVRSLPLALQRRVLLKWLRFSGISEPGFSVIESVRGLVQKEAASAKVNLTGGHHARRSRGYLWIEKAPKK